MPVSSMVSNAVTYMASDRMAGRSVSPISPVFYLLPTTPHLSTLLTPNSSCLLAQPPLPPAVFPRASALSNYVCVCVHACLALTCLSPRITTLAFFSLKLSSGFLQFVCYGLPQACYKRSLLFIDHDHVIFQVPFDVEVPFKATRCGRPSSIII